LGHGGAVNIGLRWSKCTGHRDPGNAIYYNAERNLPDSVVGVVSEPVIVRAGRGEAAPEFSARTAKGETIELAQFRGRDVVVLFWSPDCGFCRQAVDDVARWDRENAAPLVIVSSREDDELSARRLRAPLVVDETGQIGRSFGAAGTPMAVHIDTGGKIASDVAAGKDAIGRLLGAFAK